MAWIQDSRSCPATTVSNHLPKNWIHRELQSNRVVMRMLRSRDAYRYGGVAVHPMVTHLPWCTLVIVGYFV
jgi:hypothetical protein